MCSRLAVAGPGAVWPVARSRDAMCRVVSPVLRGGRLGVVAGVSLPGSDVLCTRVGVVAFAGHQRVPARLERGARLAVLPRLHAWPGLQQLNLLVQQVAEAAIEVLIVGATEHHPQVATVFHVRLLTKLALYLVVFTGARRRHSPTHAGLVRLCTSPL